MKRIWFGSEFSRLLKYESSFSLSHLYLELFTKKLWCGGRDLNPGLHLGRVAS